MTHSWPGGIGNPGQAPFGQHRLVVGGGDRRACGGGPSDASALVLHGAIRSLHGPSTDEGSAAPLVRVKVTVCDRVRAAPLVRVKVILIANFAVYHVLGHPRTGDFTVILTFDPVTVKVLSSLSVHAFTSPLWVHAFPSLVWVHALPSLLHVRADAQPEPAHVRVHHHRVLQHQRPLQLHGPWSRRISRARTWHIAIEPLHVPACPCDGRVPGGVVVRVDGAGNGERGPG